MINPEYFIYPIIMNTLKGLDTGNKLIDTILLGILIIFAFGVDTHKLKSFVFKKLKAYFHQDSPNTIVFSNEGNDRSLRFKAIMYYISKLDNPSIKVVRELARYTWNRDDEYIEKNSEFEIDQDNEFNLTDDIFGSVIQEVKEKSRRREDTEYKDIYTLKIYSNTKSLLELHKWINNIVKDYKRYIRLKASDSQLLLSINYDAEDKHLNIEQYDWESTITFDNSFFHDKEETLRKIDFFLNNKKWYQERGIPYNLGILLYGDPGGGKTRFIKQLMNYTGRHGIDIKLHDKFDFNRLKNLIHNEQIEDDYIIPQDKRIIIFEDVDAVGTVFKDRDQKKKDKELEYIKHDLVTVKPCSSSEVDCDSDSMEKEEKKQSSKKNKKKKKSDPFNLLTASETNDNNNLSYFLNIIDGLNECSGRIIIMTTNKIDYLDKALIRPGRIDIKLEFKKCTKNDIYEMIKIFWKDEFKYSFEEIKDDIDNKYTSAEIINIFRTTNNFENIKDFFIN